MNSSNLCITCSAECEITALLSCILSTVGLEIIVEFFDRFERNKLMFAGLNGNDVYKDL